MRSGIKKQVGAWRLLVVAAESEGAEKAVQQMNRAGIDCSQRVGDVAAARVICEQEEAPDLVLLYIEGDAAWGQLEVGLQLQTLVQVPIVFVANTLPKDFSDSVLDRSEVVFLILPTKSLQAQSVLVQALKGYELECEQLAGEDRVQDRPADDMHRAHHRTGKQGKELHELLQCYVDGVLMVSPDRRILYSNPAAEGIVASNPAGFLDECIGLVESEEGGGVVETLMKDGGPLSLEVLGSTVDWEGSPAIIICFRDIAERRKREEQVGQAAKMESVERLSGGIAHDFNNLLTTIFGYTELLEGELDPDSDGYSYAREVKDAVDRAKLVSDKLLAFSRKNVLTAEPVSLNALLEEFQPALAKLVGPEISLHLDLAERLPALLGDHPSLEEIFVNLVSNAHDAMPTGGTIEIKTRATAQSSLHSAVTDASDPPATGFIHIAVRDEGEGIAPEIIDKVFEPFFTTKSRGHGTGLGLSSVWGIVTKLNGSIEVQSTLGKGTVFHLFLPAVSGPIPELVPPEEVNIEIVTYREPAGEHILVVEDEPAIRALIANSLDRAGYTVHVAGHGLEALDLMREKELEPELIVTDLLMPVMNGVELAIKLQERYINSLVLFITGFDGNLLDETDLPYSRNLIKKPFDRNTLLNKVGEMLSSVDSE